MRVRSQQQTKSKKRKKIQLSTRRLGFFSMLFIYDMHFFNFPYRLHASPDTSVVLEIPPCTQQNIFKWDWNGSSSFSRLFNDNGRISAKRKLRTFLRATSFLKHIKSFFFQELCLTLFKCTVHHSNNKKTHQQSNVDFRKHSTFYRQLSQPAINSFHSWVTSRVRNPQRTSVSFTASDVRLKTGLHERSKCK